MQQKQIYVVSYLPISDSLLSLVTPKSLFSKALFAKPDARGVSSGLKRRIMIVDDEKDITMMFRSGLERNGYSVDVFNDPIEALSQFKPDHYDLLLLDIRMPEMSGFELFRKIRMQDKTAKVCFISAFEVIQEEMEKYQPEDEGMCIVKKPISMRELVRIINEELSGNA
jgi:DNA-binding response OmpR family regulator